jgi:hypothetical protein
VTTSSLALVLSGVTDIAVVVECGGSEPSADSGAPARRNTVCRTP